MLNFELLSFDFFTSKFRIQYSRFNICSFTSPAVLQKTVKNQKTYIYMNSRTQYTLKKFRLSAFADESSRDFGGQLDAVRRNNITHIELAADALHKVLLDVQKQDTDHAAECIQDET